MSTALETTHWQRGGDGDLIATAHGHELTVYPPAPTGRAFWFITTAAGDEIATGFADTVADAKADAETAVRQDLRLWDL